MFGAVPTLRFTDLLQIDKLVEEDMHDGSAVRYVEGETQLVLGMLRLPFSVIALPLVASIAMLQIAAARQHCRRP